MVSWVIRRFDGVKVLDTQAYGDRDTKGVCNKVAEGSVGKVLQWQVAVTVSVSLSGGAGQLNASRNA